MTRHRCLAFAVGTLTLCLTTAAARGQSGSIDLKPYRMEGKPLNGTGLTQLLAMKSGKVKTRGPQAAANQALFKQAAEFYVYRVTQDQYYTGNDSGELRNPTGSDKVMDEALRDLDIHLLVPKPGERILIDQMNYIEDFGAAIDQAVVAVLTSKGVPPPVIRINAARMLALAARTGAPAHAKTITALLTNQLFKGRDGKPAETPPDVLYWALKAAGNLLSAPDPSALGTPNPARHTIKDVDLVPLVQALNDLVLHNPKGLAARAGTLKPQMEIKPPPAPGAGAPKGDATLETSPTPPPPAVDPNALTAEQAALLRFFRRQAIRALAELRFDAVAEGTPNELRPGFTLAKVAASDVSLNPPPTAAEVGEAVIGLCRVHPSFTLDPDALLHVIAYGTGSFFTPKAADPDDKSIPWKSYAAQVEAAYAQLQKTAQSNPRLSPKAKQIAALAGIVTGEVTAPLTATNGTGRPNFQRLLPWVQANAPKGGLYSDGKQYQLHPRVGGR
ncbi:MAG TPA: hypothetical protein VFG68_13635 [Fimbriiglobus sp.]|nr:hypothetical protein [Fimbriiglobus sp.]